MQHPRVSIIILNWNGLSDTIECLESLRNVAYPDYEVVVVDNGSEGNDADALRQRFGDYIHVIENERNYGFAEGCNIGIRHSLRGSGIDYILLLNNDTTVAPDCLDELVKVAEGDPGIGIVGPKIYYYDFGGRADVIWSAGGKIRWWHPWVYDGIGTNECDAPRYNGLDSVDWVSGSAMMIKRSVLEMLSCLDPKYFFGNEDVEYCLRARKRGLKVVYVPTARVSHKVGKSRKKRGPSFADLPPYYRLLRRNFSAPVYGYHLLLLPVLLFHRAIFHMIRRS
jgi:GT2 family glycosyltransferase